MTLSTVSGKTHPYVTGFSQANFAPDLVCFSHLRWDFVYQRPQHLMSRFGSERRVFFVEEPVWQQVGPCFDVNPVQKNIWQVRPQLPIGMHPQAVHEALQQILDYLFVSFGITNFISWYYTPSALPFTQNLNPMAVVYDCMDELSLFKGAPTDIKQLEALLLERADVVFTGGPSLYDNKRTCHPNVHLFPSSIDMPHFRRARYIHEPAEQAHLPRPRLGFFGVIDERLDVDLLRAVAEARPDWQLVLLGPVVKIDPVALPQHPNIHYLGQQPYEQLPAYLAGWDVALIPFALSEATRFISPTKTPEYLAGGKPVVSTPICDVMRMYGNLEMVRIAASPEEFVTAIAAALKQGTTATQLEQVDNLLTCTSWDRTWSGMRALVQAVSI